MLTGLAPGVHAFEVRARRRRGQPRPFAGTAQVDGVAPDPPGGPEDPPADDPAAAAPPLSGSAATGFAASTSFLWTGADPIQTGVADDALAPATVAVLRGRVLNRMGGGIGGVRVTVLGHPELGRTATRPDGRYDVAVGGGGPVTLRFERRGYIAAQRQAEAPWQDFAAVDDVVLVPYDDQVSEVDLDAIDGFEVARGSTRHRRRRHAPGDAAVRRGHGRRDGHARRLHAAARPSSTCARPSTRSATRAPTRCPRCCRRRSGYTYAVELSADEAVDAGATDVRFDKPVVTYVDDFLGFPVGSAVPSGYYDREAGEWVAAPDGRVIEIVGETGGVATSTRRRRRRRHTGGARRRSGSPPPSASSSPASTPRASGCGASPIEHFTPWDFNWPYGPPPDAIPPPVSPPTPDDAPRPKKECFGDGSIIGCHSQRLGETLPIAGTGFSLDYWSDQVSGRLVKRALEIPLTPGERPGEPARRQARDPRRRPDASRTQFGARAEPALLVHLGRPRRLRPAHGRLAAGDDPHRLPLRPRQVRRAEGPAGGVRRHRGRRVRGRARADGLLPVAHDPRRGRRRPSAGSTRAASGLGGWTLDAHHLYDPRAHTVHMGDGRRRERRADHHRLRGHGPAAEFRGQGDGGPATAARLGYANDVELAPDGSVLVAEIVSRDVGRIRRIRPDGVDRDLRLGHRLAARDRARPRRQPLRHAAEPRARCCGSPPTAASPGSRARGRTAGRAATAARPPARSLPLPIEVAAAPDGSVYIAERERGQAGRARRHHLDGRGRQLRPAARRRRAGDAGAARASSTASPSATAGELYIGHQDNGSGAGNRIRRVDVGGTITTVAGGGPDPDVLGDGGPGTQATIGVPRGMDVGPDGALYFAELARRRARPPRSARTASSRRSPAAARPPPAATGATEAPRLRADLGSVQGVAVAPDGARVRRATTATRTSPASSGASAGRCRSATAAPGWSRRPTARRRSSSTPTGGTSAPSTA